MADFDKLWNYGDLAATEAKFRALRPTLTEPKDQAELQTQIARTLGLQRKFDGAHALLDQVEKMLTPDMSLPRVRYLLERGRVFNSSGSPEKAMTLFEQAWKLGEAAKLPRYAIDAVHMMAIAASDPRQRVEWNLRGIAMVEADDSQRGWLFALYNNLGEAYAKLGEYGNGLDAFQKLARLDSEKGNPPDMFTLKDQSRMLRRLGRSGEAMAIIQPIHERLERDGRPDGWISAEYAECLLATGNAAVARGPFATALALLRADESVRTNEPAMLQRLEQLSR